MSNISSYVMYCTEFRYVGTRGNAAPEALSGLVQSTSSIQRRRCILKKRQMFITFRDVRFSLEIPSQSHLLSAQFALLVLYVRCQVNCDARATPVTRMTTLFTLFDDAFRIGRHMRCKLSSADFTCLSISIPLLLYSTLMILAMLYTEHWVAAESMTAHRQTCVFWLVYVSRAQYDKFTSEAS